MAMSTDHQVTPTHVTHRVARKTPIALLTMRWIDRPHVLHGDVATTISVVSGAKMPNDDGEIQ